jgi:hypothetical protein
VSRVVFACINALHVADAKAVASSLTGPVAYLDLNTLLVAATPPTITTHFTALTAHQVWGALRVPGLAQGDTLVLPQDVGVLPQILRATCRRRGCRVALLPDGLVSSDPVARGSALRRRAREVAYGLLSAVGLMVGRPGIMGSSKPDLILGWGEGWRQVLATASDGSPFDPTGSPRLDAYESVADPEPGTRLLVCSQPLGLVADRALESRWYAFLAGLPPRLTDDAEVRIRLHPVERELPGVPEALRSTPATSLRDDVAWATHVAAPFSTVLAEALVAGRIPLALVVDELAGFLDSIPLFADPRFPRAGWSQESVEAALLEPVQSRQLADAYVAGAGTASRRVAHQIQRLHEGRDHA